MKRPARTAMMCITLCISILICSACSAENAQEENLSRLFTVETLDGEECLIQLDDSRVQMIETEGLSSVMLILEGQLPSGCGNLMVRIDPPSVTKQINVILLAKTSSSNLSEEDDKPFYISMPLEHLMEGTYSVVINEEASFHFTYMNN